MFVLCILPSMTAENSLKKISQTMQHSQIMSENDQMGVGKIPPSFRK